MTVNMIASPSSDDFVNDQHPAVDELGMCRARLVFVVQPATAAAAAAVADVTVQIADDSL